MTTYLSSEVLAGFDKYKYSAVDTSPVSKYITHPFWNWVVEFVPKWVAPNLLTLTGFCQLLVNFALLTYYDPHFFAASRDYPEAPPIPNWVWLVCAFNNFMSHTLDGIDGKQARRTGSSSPLGELFDHGLDSWATLFLPVALYSIFGRGEYGVGVFRVYFIVTGVMLCFILSHWEKYNTKILFLPWGYDLSQLAMTGVYLLTFVGGHDLWKFKFPVIDMYCSEVIEIVMYVGFFILTFPATFWNIYKSYRDGTGKLYGPWEMLRPLVSTFLLFSLMVVWAQVSSCQVMELQPRLFYWTTGTAFSNIACWLIISQMSDTRCELINWLILPLAAIVTASSLLSLGQLEVYLLWAYCCLVTGAHLHFGIHVVQEMCDHFKISALTIKPKQ